MAEYKHPSDDMQPREECSPAPQPKKSAMALYMDSLGLVNIAELDSSITVKLMYTQADNFTGPHIQTARQHFVVIGQIMAFQHHVTLWNSPVFVEQIVERTAYPHADQFAGGEFAAHQAADILTIT